MKTDHRSITLLICLILGAVLAQAQGFAPSGIVPTEKASNTVSVSGLLRGPLPGHAVAQGAPITYNAETLYQYIDGGADLYLLYDFKALLHQEFKSGTTDLTVDLYEMGNGDDAFGIYSSERSPNYKFLSIGAEGYRDKGILNFLGGQYYVKLSGSGPGVDTLFDEFARLLSSRIGGSRSLPALLAQLPREGRISHSEQYIKKDPLGHAFLSPAYIVTYAQGRQQMKLVVSVANDRPAAKLRAEQFAKHFKQSGEAVLAPELGENGMRGSNSFEGHVIARTRGRYLIAVFNPGQNGAGILQTAARSLP
ncbi:MAG: DUF6599 family protein [Candidatus Sulfotelmatobacter sp.]